MDLTELLETIPVPWDRVLQFVIGEMDCEAGTLHGMKDDNTLKLLACQKIPDHLLPVISEIPVGKGIAGAAAQRREPVEICNLQEDDGGGVARPAARDTKVAGSLAVPIQQGETLLGSLGVGKSVPHQFTDEEKARLANFADLIAAKLA